MFWTKKKPAEADALPIDRVVRELDDVAATAQTNKSQSCALHRDMTLAMNHLKIPPHPVKDQPVGDNGQPIDPSEYRQITLERKRIVERIGHLRPDTDAYATEFAEQILEFARRVRTSDVHLQPTYAGLEVRFRNDGVLQPLGEFPIGASSSIVSRLKVLSNLLTYRSDIPQEGRITVPGDGVEIRFSTFPTLHGERGVLRFFGHGNRFRHLDELGHTDDVLSGLRECLAETSGAVLICGPAGSGKSTTLYACMRELVGQSGGARNLMSLEDPIEVPIDGISQSQVNLAVGFSLQSGLRSLLRQDPEVIMIGEIRDPETAEIAIQACLTGQLMLTSFHSDSAVTAVSRLLDMGIEPYLLRSGIIGICCQRLLRKLCHCARKSRDANDFYGLPIDSCHFPVGCDVCSNTGYQGRVLVSEFLSLRESGLAEKVLDTRDSRATYRIAVDNGMKSLWERATDLVREGETSPEEVRRVLGVSMRI